MIHFIEEGKTVPNGLSLYKPNDKSSFGFKYRYGRYVPGTGLKDKMFMVRYSKFLRKWFVKKYYFTADSVTLDENTQKD